MKTQKLITGYNLERWNKLIEIYLADGWVVVPGTVGISVIDTKRVNDFIDGSYAVVIEEK